VRHTWRRLSPLGVLVAVLCFAAPWSPVISAAQAQPLLQVPRVSTVPAGLRSAPDPRLRTVQFDAGTVVDVPVRRGQITQIVLGDDEQIVGIPISGKGSNCSSEAHTWCVGKQGRDLFVKPKTGATSMNLIVVTDRRRHAFLLHPVEGSGLTLMRLTVAAPVVPRLIAVAASPVLPTARELIDARWQVKPLVRNSAYSVATGKDSEDIVPVMVFDDGTQTYFSFPNNRPIPTVFQIAPDGSEEMVNARMDTDDLLVADRVGRRFVLRLGQSVAAIINDAFDLDGVPPKDGTTVPGVARVVKMVQPAQPVQAIHAAQPNRASP
jgi:type IV secretion system protein VirB9